MKLGIFDLDGTIADSMGIWNKIGELYLSEKGVEVPKNLNESLEKLSLEEGIYYLKKIGNLNLSVEEINKEIKELLAYYYREEIKIKDFVFNYLKSLKNQGVKMVIATVNDKFLTEEFLKKHKIDDCFQAIETPETIGYSKDRPEFFHTLIEKLDIGKENIWVFEDAPHSIVSAKKAGLKVVAVKDKTWTEEEDKIKEMADIYIEDFEKMEEYDLWKNY